jgi:protein subunit release factor A
LTLSFDVSERFAEAAAEWGDARLMDEEEALEVKAEQALLEIEHLVSSAHDVEFAVEGRTIHHEPTADLEAFLETQSEATGVEADVLLRSYADLFARAYLDEDTSRPSNAPPS